MLGQELTPVDGYRHMVSWRQRIGCWTSFWWINYQFFYIVKYIIISNL